MKYLISAIIYLAIASVINGLLESILGKSFIEGMFPDSIGRWVIRLLFTVYFSMRFTIDFKNLRDSR